MPTVLGDIFGVDGVIVLAVVLVVLFGGAAIPKFARSLGSARHEFAKGLDHGQSPRPTEVLAHHGLFGDTHLHVDDTGGGGRPVVLIHGWPLSGEAFSGQLPALGRAGYRVVTYDRRGFGRSDKPLHGYGFDTLAEDLHSVLVGLDLRDVTVVGCSMGGGEVARYLSAFGPERLRSVVFVSAVTPYMLHTEDNPEGPLRPTDAAQMAAALAADQESFYDQFMTRYFSAGGRLQVTETQRRAALALCRQADTEASVACMAAFGSTDFRGDLRQVTTPSLILHGSGDETVPYAGSGLRTHGAVPGSRVHLIPGAPHGCNVSHAAEWNGALVDFLGT